MQTNQPHFIDVAQLQVGMYVHLDLGWMDHPFPLSNFKVKDEDQISIIKKTGLKKLRYDPTRSDCPPLQLTEDKPSEAQPIVENNNDSAKPEAIATQPDTKKVRLKELHHAINECEKKRCV